MPRNLPTECIFVGCVFAMLYWVLRSTCPAHGIRVEVAVAFAAAIIGHVLFEHFGWNATFCRLMMS